MARSARLAQSAATSASVRSRVSDQLIAADRARRDLVVLDPGMTEAARYGPVQPDRHSRASTGTGAMPAETDSSGLACSFP